MPITSVKNLVSSISRPKIRKLKSIVGAKETLKEIKVSYTMPDGRGGCEIFQTGDSSEEDDESEDVDVKTKNSSAYRITKKILRSLKTRLRQGHHK
jgi:hypothetical protein